MVIAKTVGGGYPTTLVHEVFREAPYGRWKSDIIEKCGNKAEYSVFPVLKRSHNFPLLLNNTGIFFRSDLVHGKKFPEVQEDSNVLTACQRYTGQDFWALNLCLNLLSYPNDFGLMYGLLLLCLQTTIIKPPPKVFRFCNLNVDESRFYLSHVGKTIFNTGFLSTSRKQIKDFGNTKFEIDISNSHLKGCCDISPFSVYKDEEEILLCCYSEFVITSVDKSSSPMVISLLFKGFHQFSWCENLDVDPFQAAELGQIDYFESGVFSETRVDCRNARSQPILYIAARFGQTQVASWLLKHGANIDAVHTDSGSTPLHAACFYEHLEVAKLLLDTGASITIRNQYDKTVKEESGSFFTLLQQ